MEVRVPLPSEERRCADQWYVCEGCGMKLRRGLLSAIWHVCPGCRGRMALAATG